MNNGNGPPARIQISENKDGKLLFHLEWPNQAELIKFVTSFHKIIA